MTDPLSRAARAIAHKRSEPDFYATEPFVVDGVPGDGWQWKNDHDKELARAAITAFLSSQALVEAVARDIAKRGGCDLGTFTVCWGEQERVKLCQCKAEARAALAALRSEVEKNDGKT